MSMAIVNAEKSVLRVAINCSLQIFESLGAEEHKSPNLRRAMGSIMRMQLSAAMFAIERSNACCAEIVMDGIVRAFKQHTDIARQEFDEVFSISGAPGTVEARQNADEVMKEAVVWQLGTGENPKLDLDREDLLVNADTIDSCALTVLDLVEAYGILTGRLETERLVSERVRIAVEAERGRLRPVYSAWLHRVCGLESPLVVKAGRMLLMRVTPSEEKVEALDVTLREFLRILADRLQGTG